MVIRLTLILTLMLTVLTAYAQDARQILARITGHYESVSTLRADFVQSNTWPASQLSKVSKGTLSYDRTHLALVYSDPAGQSLTIQDRTVTMIDRSQKQAVISSLDNVVAGIKPIEIIRHYSAGATLDTVTRGGKTWLLIRPSTSADLKKIEVLDDGRGSILEIAYEDPEGNLVRYSFSRVSENVSLAAFDARVPRGFEIIDTRK